MRSRSTAGRRAIHRLRGASCDLGEAKSLLDLSRFVARAAVGLGDLERTNDLILRAPKDVDVGLVVLAGFGSALDLISRLVLRSAPSALDVRFEAVAFAWEAIVEAPQSSHADLARFVARRTWSRTWSSTRRECRAVQRFGYAPGSELLDTRIVESEESGLDLFLTWVGEGIVTESQVELIRKTRIDGWSLVDLATARGIEVATLQQRRRRAESAIRAAANASGHKSLSLLNEGHPNM